MITVLQSTSRMASLGAFAAVCVLFAAVSPSQASEQTGSALSEECRTAWDEATASEHCVLDTGISFTEENGDCALRAQCYLTVAVGETDREFRNHIFQYDPHSVTNTATLDLCFSIETDESRTSDTHINIWERWRMDVKT